MSAFEGMSIVDRAEIDAAIDAAYNGPSGVRGRSQAVAEFEQFFASATQAGREWTEALRGEWIAAGLAAFVANRWKVLGGRVHMRHPNTNAPVGRPMRRGTTVLTDEGRPQHVQIELPMWDAAALERGIAEAVRRIDTERTTIANYRKLLDLLEVTGCRLVGEACDAVGKTLDEVLADEAVPA